MLDYCSAVELYPKSSITLQASHTVLHLVFSQILLVIFVFQFHKKMRFKRDKWFALNCSEMIVMIKVKLNLGCAKGILMWFLYFFLDRGQDCVG